MKYNIAPENFLDNIINDFFEQDIQKNPLYIKAIKIVLKNEKDATKLKKTIHTFISLFKSNNYNLIDFKTILNRMKLNIKDYKINKNMLLLIINVYLKYEYELSVENAIDFNDMINKCINIIKEKGITTSWKYIIVDEYQDTSQTKYELLQEIIKQTNAKFLAVGDDFQSIYRFTGCNLQIFLQFQKLFSESKIFQIINTYRNPQELINIAGNFVMKNKKQQKKELKSIKKLDKPLKIIYSNNNILTFKKLLEKLSNKEIMVLGRNNKDIANYIDNSFIKIKDNHYKYNNTTFRYLTIHKSKGLESEVTIIINLENSPTGIPSKIENEKILKYVNNTKDYYPYEE